MKLSNVFLVIAILLSLTALTASAGTDTASERVIKLRAGERIEVQCKDERLYILPDSKDETDILCGLSASSVPTNTVKPTKTSKPTKTDETAQPTSTPSVSSTATSTSTPGTTVTASATRTPTQVGNVPTSTNTPSGPVINVSAGSDLQGQVNAAQPGSTLQLADGTYNGEFVINKALTIRGSRNAIVRGSGRVIEIQSSNVTLDGFTMAGGEGTGTGILVFVGSRQANTPLTGLEIKNMKIGGAGGECIRFRYFVQGAQVHDNQIGPCGFNDFPNGVYAGGGKNGEGVYIGTAPEQRGDGKNPNSAVDQSNGNHVFNNAFNTQGNECVDIKEGATNNLVEGNTCTGQKDPNSAGFDSRGNANIFRNNVSTGNVGGGFRFGGDTSNDGINNIATGNTVTNNQDGGFKIQVLPQGQICGNTVSGNGGDGASNQSSINPAAPCP